jgi:hypothetical protein
LKLKNTSRTISANAVVATTSISPFTRSAGKPTATATAADTSAPTASAHGSGQPAITVSMPAAYAPIAKKPPCARLTCPVCSTHQADRPSSVCTPITCARPR